MPWPFDTTDSGTWDANAAQNGAPQAYAPQSVYAPQGGAWGMFSPTSLLNDPEFRRHAAYDALTNAGLSLIAASAPSTTPTNIGTMFGSLAGGAAQGVQGSADRYMKLGTQAAQMRMLQAQAEAYPEAVRLMRKAAGGGAYNPYGPGQPPQQATPAPQDGTATPPAPDLQTAGQPQVDYLVKKYGLTPVAASGVVGGLYQESKFNPAAKGDGGKSTGMAQWDPERYAGLTKFADAQGKPPTDPQTQLDYVMTEMKGGDMGAQRAFAQLQTAKTPADATTAMMHFFRPAGYTPANPTAGNGYQNRLLYSSALAQGYPGNVAQGNGGPPMAGDPQAAPPQGQPVQLAQAGPQPGTPQQPPQPVALPRLPINPPNPAKFMGLTMLGGPFAKSAEMLSKGEQAQFDAAMKIYNAQLAGTKEQREQAVSPINPDGSINQSVVAAAGAKTDAEKHYAESTAPYKEPDIQEFVRTLPKQTQAAFNSAVGRGDTKEAGELLDKATGGIPIELLKLRGPALMEKLPPSEQSILSGLLDGSISIQDLPQRAAAAGSRMDLLALAKRVDPDFSTTNGPSRKAFEENLSHGQGLQMLSSLNVAPQHMLQYRKLMQGVQNGNTQLISEVHNYIAEHLGHPEITSAKAMQEFLATEVARAVHGAGALGESTVESALSKIGTQQSDAQNIGVLNEWAKALSARTSFLQYQASARHHIPERTWRTYVQPEARDALDELGRQASAPAPGPASQQGAPQQSQLPQPTTPAEAMKLPSGTVFRTPDGRTKVRP